MIEMLIQEFAEKYNVTKREIDYWTTLGLLHPDIRENGYRAYGERADREIGDVLIALLIDRPGSLESKYDMLNGFSAEQWDTVKEKIDRTKDRLMTHLDIAYEAASRRRGE